MSAPSLRRLYAALLLAAFCAVALWRRDLTAEAWRVSASLFAQGGPSRVRLLAEGLLFSGILAACWRVVASRPSPARDAAILVVGAAAGWSAEAWGTRVGLWSYYTGERPPLWIVPAWPLGALMIGRLASQGELRWGPARPLWYWPTAAAALLVCLGFCAPRLGQPQGWLGPAAAAAGLFWRCRPEKDFWPLATGLACVFFADLWGTSNGCWRYYLHDRPHGLWAGIAFGMAFDTGVVMACLKLTRVLNRTFA